MERREQYDPEDIESLLNERSFDELLEEERAYVLRHLANREEYETMRVLLHQVRNDERNEGPIVAPAEVRAHVLDVFRQQQQPQWRVWLNSIGAVMWPKEMSAMWRPALALGSVVLLVTSGVFVFRQADEDKAQLAELRPAKKEIQNVEHPAPAQQPAPALDSVVNASVSGLVKTTEDVRALEQGAFKKPDQVGYVQAVPSAAQATDAAAERSYTTVSGSTAATFDAVAVAPTAENLEGGKAAVIDDEQLAKQEVSTSAPHEVTELELARNESTGNATGRVRGTAKRKAEAFESVTASSRSLGDDAALVSLLNSGW